MKTNKQMLHNVYLFGVKFRKGFTNGTNYDEQLWKLALEQAEIIKEKASKKSLEP